MRSKIAFYASILAFVFACLTILDLSVNHAVTGWLFTAGAIGTLVSIGSAVILEISNQKTE